MGLGSGADIHISKKKVQGAGDAAGAWIPKAELVCSGGGGCLVGLLPWGAGWARAADVASVPATVLDNSSTKSEEKLGL